MVMSSPHRYFLPEPRRCSSSTRSQNVAFSLPHSTVAGLCLVAAPAVVREDLRIDEPVAEIAVEAGVEPIHHLVDPGALRRSFG